MSLMSRRVLTERWPSARRVLPLPLLLCLGWLWAAIPVIAQDQMPLPAVEATGPYHNLAENHAGAFHLKREGGVVYATFQTDRSPVQFLARDQPEVLLTVPEGFRPAMDVTWEVSAQPVQADGAPRPDHSDRRVFRMRVDTAGQVRYVDDPGVDGVGYFRYRTALAWPLAGTEPQVCDRHWNIREGILAAVQALEDAAVPCSQVDWTRLADIRTLSLDVHSENFARHDLLGLTNLTALQVSTSWATYPDDLLAHTPRLRTMRIGGWHEALPADLFRYTPLLAHLSLRDDSRQDMALPVDLLAHTPHLESLQLESSHPAELTWQLLARTPRLTRLTVTPTTPLPETFLAAVPQLTHLTVKDGLEPCATPQLLAPVPHLRHFAVRMDAEVWELNCLGRGLRLHTPDLAELHVEIREMSDLDAEVLPSLPRLTRLSLDMDDMTVLPAQLLARAPELTHLALHGGTDLTLPAGFLTHTPRLTDLSLRANNLKNFPPDLLSPVPDLQRLEVVTRNLTSLPTWFLDRMTELRVNPGWLALPADFLIHAPYLEVLHLDSSLKSLPEGFLTYAPSLVKLHLHMPNLWALPPTFLAHAPHLVELRLDVPLLQALPPTFLTHAPSLETFRLEADQGTSVSYYSSLESFPEGFLTHAPSLVELRLRVPRLQAFPSSFLGHVPRLEILELETTYNHPSPHPDKLPIRSLPANFLTHAPRLRHLDLEPLGHVKAFPQGFLSGSPQLRYLNLDARGAAALPADFLSRHPRLETIRLRANHMPALPQGFLSQSPNLADLKLDLKRVEALPEGFLSEMPRLWNLEIDVHGVAVLPSGFLAHAPQLTHLNLRALNLTAWPADFLAHAPRVQTLGLAMPLLEPTLTPDHRLWDTLQATSLRVKVTRPDPIGEPDPYCQGNFKLGDILEVEGRALDDHGRMLLLVFPWQERELFAHWSRVPYWREHGLFVTHWEHYCLYLLDTRFTAPTLEVCADRNPDYCEPVGEPYEDPAADPFPG